MSDCVLSCFGIANFEFQTSCHGGFWRTLKTILCSEHGLSSGRNAGSLPNAAKHQEEKQAKVAISQLEIVLSIKSLNEFNEFMRNEYQRHLLEYGVFHLFHSFQILLVPSGSNPVAGAGAEPSPGFGTAAARAG